MRSISEIGKLENYGEKVNKTYSTYASIYLDCVDDNINHFLLADMMFL